MMAALEHGGRRRGEEAVVPREGDDGGVGRRRVATRKEGMAVRGPLAAARGRGDLALAEGTKKKGVARSSNRSVVAAAQGGGRCNTSDVTVK